MQAAKCAGRTALVSARVNGGVAPYSFSWSSSASHTVKANPSPISVFDESLLVPSSFSLSSGAALSVQCNGTASGASSHTGYCALGVTPSSNTTLISLGCNDCFVFSQVCLSLLLS